MPSSPTASSAGPNPCAGPAHQRGRRSTFWIVAAVFLLGLTLGVQAGKNDRVTSDLFLGKDARSASDALLEKALVQADDGSWERIAVAQMYYLSGRRERGEALIEGIRKKDASDWVRIGRVYQRSGEWEKAEEAFARVIEMAPKDEDWLAEIGMYYNLQGERAEAEKLFVRAFELDPDNLYNTLKAAGSYIGIEER